MPKKTVNAVITTIEHELKFTLQPHSTGQMLFDQVTKIIGLREIWFFGLEYVDDKGFTTWLLLNKKILHQVGSKLGNPLKFRFRVKFYPKDVGAELIQEITIRMFYLQVKNSILGDEVYCPLDAALLLSSYAVQVKYGDFVPEDHKPGFLANDKLIPQHIMDQHKLTSNVWEEKITVLYKERKGLLREEAMMEYLRLAQNLEMYGVNYFDIENKNGTRLSLGVHACGIHVYERQDKLTQKVRFPWEEIRNMNFNTRKFIIKPMDKKAPDVIFTSAHIRVMKTILYLSMGNYHLNVRRGMADTIEVQMMKIQAREERMAKKQAR